MKEFDPEDGRVRGAAVEFAEELLERGGDTGGGGTVALERVEEAAKALAREEADVFRRTCKRDSG